MARQPYRVLQVVAVMNRGGTETMLMNHYRALDKGRVQFDFLVHTQQEGAYDKEILASGGRIFHAPKIRPWSYRAYFKWLSAFFREHGKDFIAVHSHIQENSGFALKYAHRSGITHRLMSSHTAPKSLDYKFFFRWFANIFAKRHVSCRLACGEAAGKHLYGSKEFIVFRNAINTANFTFNPQLRRQKRAESGISDDDIVIGHVGRFDGPKNQRFIINVISELAKSNTKVKALLIGEGPLLSAVKQQAEDLGVADRIRFLGSRADVNELLQAFDVFLMPSLYEGLPVSVIEAQAAGLPCVLADTIDRDCDVTGRVKFLSLALTPAQWCDAITEALTIPRTDTRDLIVKAGYDVTENLKLLLPLYGINE